MLEENKMLTSIIAGAIIGMIAGALTSSDDRRGCLGNIILGLAGSWIGQLLFGGWGPQFAGMALVPSVCGLVSCSLVVGGHNLLAWLWYRQSLEQYCWWPFFQVPDGVNK